MKKHVKSLLAATLLVGSVAQADTVTNKTFLHYRSVGSDLARLDSIWHRQLHRPNRRDDQCRRRFGAHLQAVGFFEDGTNKKGIGQYFGFGNDNTLVVGPGGVAGTDIDTRFLIFNSANITPNTLAGTIHLGGKYRAAGVEFSYYQNLDCLLKGLNFLLVLPVASVKSYIDLKVTDETTQTVAGTTFGILDYFEGNISQAAGINQQAALTRALIEKNHGETALADLDFRLQYDFYRTKHHHVGINFGFTAPTGNDCKGRRVFESISGNGGFWGVGAGLTAGFTPWKSCNQSIEFFFDIKYRYLLKDDCTRTVGIKNQNWGQYQLLGTIGSTGVTPAANILTRRVDVTPGSQVDAVGIFAYNYGGFTLDLGYELYAAQSEKVRVKSWDDDLYALAGNDYDASVAFTLNDIALNTQVIGASAISGAGATLTISDLDTSVAETPSYVTNKIFGALGYGWYKWSVPFMLKLGGSYEFAPRRKAISKWAVFGGFGINF